MTERWNGGIVELKGCIISESMGAWVHGYMEKWNSGMMECQK